MCHSTGPPLIAIDRFVWPNNDAQEVSFIDRILANEEAVKNWTQQIPILCLKEGVHILGKNAKGVVPQCMVSERARFQTQYGFDRGTQREGNIRREIQREGGGRRGRSAVEESTVWERALEREGGNGDEVLLERALYGREHAVEDNTHRGKEMEGERKGGGQEQREGLGQ
ncbi:hypothetical protein RJT34_20408 [Clitoria ternatea]|uniref:Uncharacterized protein n=1 Tax=Clitoria ternatea TaxID=43366 RepID=A0AAN9IT36_CLITE